MKLPVIATILLVLMVPASAASKKDMDDIHNWEDLNGTCVYGVPSLHPDIDKICAAADVLGKKLVARGYCMFGHGVVGRTGRRWTKKEWERAGFPGTVPKDMKHCYVGFRKNDHYHDPPLEPIE